MNRHRLQHSSRPWRVALGLLSASLLPAPAGADDCLTEWQGPPAGAVLESLAGKTLAALQDPAAAGCGAPVEVRSVYWTAFNVLADVGHFELQAVLYGFDAATGGPGEVIATGPILGFDLLGRETRELELGLGGGVHLFGRYFAGVVVHDTPAPSIVIVDDGSDLRSQTSYLGTGGTWLDVVDDLSYPGNPLLNSSGNSGSDPVEENRRLVEEHRDVESYPRFEGHLYSGDVEIAYLEAWFDANRRIIHFPGDLRLRYDACDVRPFNDATLEWTMFPRNGDGLEYDREDGTKFMLRVLGYGMETGLGVDYEEHFVPPLRGRTLEFSDLVGRLFEWSMWCVAWAVADLVEYVQLEIQRWEVDLIITSPTDNSVTFEGGSRRATLEFDEPNGDSSEGSNSVQQLVLEVRDHVGEIEIEVERADSDVRENLRRQIEIDGCIRNCLPFVDDICGDAVLSWDEGTDYTRVLDLNEDESDDLSWTLESDPIPCLPWGRPAQNLIQRTVRPNPLVPGEPDTLVTTISNLYGDICWPYDSLVVDYFLELGGGPVLLGSQAVDASDLSAFNDGLIDSVTVAFVFLPTHAEYVFRKDQIWPAGSEYPVYRSVLTATPVADVTTCPDWTVAELSGPPSGNDVRAVSFERPLPDFSISVPVVDGAMYLPLGGLPEHMEFDLTITNRGITWPVAGTTAHSADIVYVEGVAVYERWNGSAWLPYRTEPIGTLLVTSASTPLGTGESRGAHFEYDLRPPRATRVGAVNRRVRFVFEVNGGPTADGARVWEQSFANNGSDAMLYTKPTTEPSGIRWR